MKPISNVRIEAAKRFNPKNLCNYLMREKDGTVVVDRAKILKSQDDERLFIVTMNADYEWNYAEYDDSTIYFQIEREAIVGGIYNSARCSKVTRRQIAVPSADGITRSYVYSQDVFEKMCESITNA